MAWAQNDVLTDQNSQWLGCPHRLWSWLRDFRRLKALLHLFPHKSTKHVCRAMNHSERFTHTILTYLGSMDIADRLAQPIERRSSWCIIDFQIHGRDPTCQNQGSCQGCTSLVFSESNWDPQHIGGRCRGVEENQGGHQGDATWRS